MHGGGRQRNFGNGYRSGFGMSGGGSRISPDRPIRGHGFFGSGSSDHHHHQNQHRGFNNRGYGRGRGRSKPFQNHLPPPPPPPPPPPQAVVQRSRSSGDVFMDAGRLAVEYLVSQGVLPQTVLSGKLQRGEFRLQEAALAPAVDKRRYVDGYNSAGSRNSLQGRRSNRYDSDFGRSGSWSERSNKGYEGETGDGSVSGHREEQQTLAEDMATSSVQRSGASGEFMRKREGAGDSESVLDKYNLQDEAQSKTGSSSAGKEVLQDCEISKVSEGSCSLSGGSGEMVIGRTGGGENESQAAIEDVSIHQHEEEDEPIPADESFTKSGGTDLATLCKFDKVPTRMRSSLTAKNTKLHSSQKIKEASDNPGLLEEETRGGQSSGKADGTVDETFNDLVEEDLPLENSKCHRSNSFPNSILRENNEKDSELELPNIQRSYSLGKGGEKRANESIDMEEGAKRQKNWVSLPVSEARDRFNTFKAIDEEDEEEEKTISFYMKLIDGGAVGKTESHESLANKGNDSIIQSGKSGPGGYAAEEHQLFPASFKMCDLNLGGTADGNNDVKRESGQAVGFDLSISSSSKSLDFGGTNNNTRMSNGKEIEVIDLDNDDSPEVVKSTGRKQEAGPYMGIDDVPDYNEGLMMVEYLDSFGNAPPMNNQGISASVPQNNNDVARQDQREGALGNEQAPNSTDDDSIFMSLGEIPLTFLQTWDQPPARGYEKPF